MKLGAIQLQVHCIGFYYAVGTAIHFFLIGNTVCTERYLTFTGTVLR